MSLLLLAALRRRWPELLLALLAVAVVTAGVVVQRTVTGSAEEAVHALAHRLGANMLVLPVDADLADFHAQRFGPQTLPGDAVARLRASEVAEHLRSVEARLYGQLRVNGADVVVVGQDLGWPPGGELLPAVAGADAARRAGLATGRPFQLNGLGFQVLQIPEAMPEGLDSAVFVPLAAAQEALGRPGQLSALRLGGCWCRIDVPTLAAKVEQILPGTRAFTVKGLIAAQQGSVATVAQYSGLIASAGALAVAAIVAAFMASLARRRARELALLVAMGASPRQLAALLVAQAALLGATGAALGWALAFPLGRLLGARLLGQALSPGPGLFLPAVGLTALAAAAAAALPAAAAARLDPTLVLRET